MLTQPKPSYTNGRSAGATIACATRCAAPSEWTPLQGHERND
jgi:hypothetical protein